MSESVIKKACWMCSHCNYCGGGECRLNPPVDKLYPVVSLKYDWCGQFKYFLDEMFAESERLINIETGFGMDMTKCRINALTDRKREFGIE
jgi:hypothetical protein